MPASAEQISQFLPHLSPFQAARAAKIFDASEGLKAEIGEHLLPEQHRMAQQQLSQLLLWIANALPADDRPAQ